MSRNITNCIQKTYTKSDNTVIFNTIIGTRFRYICYLDIFRFLYIRTELIQAQKDPIQNSHINL